MSEAKQQESVSVELIDGETGRCIGINDYRICGPKPIHGVVVTLWKTTKNDVLRAFLTPDEKHDWLAKDLTVVPVEQARLTALVPGLVGALEKCQTYLEHHSHEQRGVYKSLLDVVDAALNAVAKESQQC